MVVRHEAGTGQDVSEIAAGGEGTTAMSTLIPSLFPSISSRLSGSALGVSLAGVGMFVGMLTGLFGVGGGFLVVPLLYALLGLPYDLAVGSSLGFIVGSSILALPPHWRAGNVDQKTALWLSGGSMVGAVLGDLLQETLAWNVAGGERDVYERIMSLLFVLLLSAIAWGVFRDRAERCDGLSVLQRFPVGPRVDLLAAGRPGTSLPGLLGVGLFIGMLTGLFGVGGGVLFVPVLLLVVGLEAHKAVGTSLAAVLLAAAAGVAKKTFDQEVSLSVVFWLLAGSVFGTRAGARMCLKLPARSLRRTFALVVLLAAAMLLADVIRRQGT